MMHLYFAPMEGITGNLYRNVHHRIFGAGNVDKYFAPFIFANPAGKLSEKEMQQLAPKYNEGFTLIPQLLTNQAEDFIKMAKALQKLGHEEVNLNLGCPSGTVALKGRGAGFLSYPKELEAFLSTIFDALDMRISIKTRLGMNDASEFDELLEIYKQFPIAELIIHPRVRQQFYAGEPDGEAFEKALVQIKTPLCYNGDIFTVDDFHHMQKKYPTVSSYMMGRGLLTNPALCREIRGGSMMTNQELLEFYQELQEGYDTILNGSIKSLNLMKEFWRYIAMILSEEDRQAVRGLLYINDREDFMRKSCEIASHCQVVQGQGYGVF